jgi:hypothetical protein
MTAPLATPPQVDTAAESLIDNEFLRVFLFRNISVNSGPNVVTPACLERAAALRHKARPQENPTCSKTTE